MKSMTGFGRSSLVNEQHQISIEIKSYNSRYLDIFVTVPHDFSAFEPLIRTRMTEVVNRGKVEIVVRYKTLPTEKSYNKEAAVNFKALLKAFSEEGLEPSYRLSDLDKFGVFSNEDDQLLKETFTQLFEEALEQFMTFRRQEGEHLYADLSEQLNFIAHEVSQIEALAPEADNLVKTTLNTRFKEIVGQQIEEKRLLEETASYLIKTNINEEIVRLKSHLKALKAVLAEEQGSGRKIDFLSQELNREINTIGSKTPLVSIQQINVGVKEAIEKIREQARNVE